MSKSLQEARLPDVWKKASIVPLRKAGKEDYTSVKSYRPISLLQTVSKILESVVAERVSYLVETHGLLPRTHFGARKQRSSTDALVYLQEKIYDAWRGKETLSLVSFDVKGAYNNVAKEPELHRLRKKGIPEQLVRWIDNYCTGRRASVVVNGHRTNEEELPHSGLPQGSPLSPILFLFFNADLLEQAIPNGGTMAFVDDYTAWVVGTSAEDNTNVIQQTVLPRLKEWEESSGAVFEASKTVFVHYTRSRRQGAVSDKVLTFKGEDIKPTCAAKILGVIMDSALKFRQHLARASKRAVAAAQAVRIMKNMRPSTTRQLVSSMVFPVVDYASVVWSPGATDRTLAALKTVQRTSAQAVIHGFRTVSLEIAETEAALPTTKQRLRAAATRYWIRAQALPRAHPVSVLTRARPCVRFNSPLQKVVKWCAAMRTRIEPIPAFSEAPWDPPIHTEILDKEQAKNYGEPLGVVVTFYTDASIREGSVAIGVWHQTASSMRSLGPSGKWTVVHAEMEALIHAAEKAPAFLPTVLYTDSKQAIRNLNDRRRSDTSSSRKRFRAASVGKQIKVCWVPGHAGVEGNIRADELAKRAHTEGIARQQATALRTPLRILHAVHRTQIKAIAAVAALQRTTGGSVGRFTKRIDASYSSGHTKDLYNNLTAAQAAVLAQLRTGICRLNSYLYRIGVTDTQDCECGLPETVPHFLFSCSRWIEQRREMREAHGEWWGNLSHAVGGRPAGMKEEGWRSMRTVVLATIAFARTTGRLAPGGV